MLAVMTAVVLVTVVITAGPAMAQDEPEDCPPLGLLAVIDPDTGAFLGCTSPSDPCPPGFEAVFVSSFELFCEEVEEAPVNASQEGLSITQELEQEADSGDVDQSFEVSGSGNNVNQCAGIQGITNTGNSQNLFGFNQYDSRIDDLETEDSGSDLTVDGTAATECTQEVNQAAAAG